MKKFKDAPYYLETVEPNQEEGTIHTAKIGCDSHGECIIVFGTNKDLTPRVIAILEALNKEEPF